jgi:hypothetical protein
MALKWIEGFEIGRMRTELEDKYDVYYGPANTGYTGRLAGNAGYPTYLTTPSLGSTSTWIVGFGFKRTSSATHQYFDIYLGASRQLTIKFHSNGIGTDYNIKVLRGATELATGSTSLAFNTWYYIEFKVVIDPSAGAFEVRVNEAQDSYDTGVNTAESGSANADVFHLRNPWNAYIDDWYICNNSGATCNDFLGDCQIEGIFPNGAGDRTEWDPSAGSNYACVDDPQSAYNTGDYVYDDTAGQGDLYEFGDPGAISGEIKGIAIINFAALSAAGSRVVRNIYKTDGGGTEYDLSGNFAVASTDPAGFVMIQEQNPDTSDAWTESELQNGQFGVEVVS